MSANRELPPDYSPYETITLCTNTLSRVGAIFQIDDAQPLLVGRGGDGHPLIWLQGRVAPTGPWLTVVKANNPVSFFGPNKRMVNVITDATRPQTLVMVGSVVVVNAMHDRQTGGVDISALDLRPLGLNISGDDHIGLLFGGNLFVGNKLSGAGAAFASVQFQTDLNDFNRRIAERVRNLFPSNVTPKQAEDGRLYFRGPESTTGAHVVVYVEPDAKAALDQMAASEREKMEEHLIDNLVTQIRAQYDPNKPGQYALRIAGTREMLEGS